MAPCPLRLFWKQSLRAGLQLPVREETTFLWLCQLDIVPSAAACAGLRAGTRVSA